jgi:hypothetical protein
MKWLVFGLMTISLAAHCKAQEQRPLPTASPVPTPSPSNSLDPPLPQGDAESRAAPALLPESSLLPSTPASLNPDKPSEPQLSPEQRKQNEKRVAEIRLLAMHHPQVVSLLGEANTALTTEARRNFLRAYFITLCTHMRRIEPELGGSISSFQREQIRRIARSKNLSVTSAGTLAE